MSETGVKGWFEDGHTLINPKHIYMLSVATIDYSQTV